MIKTSAPRILTFREAPSADGFTLIEILVVIFLIAVITSVAIPNIGMALRVNIRNSAKELATTIRSAHDEAVLKGQMYRIAFDMESSQYWVESGPKGFLIRTAKQQEEEKRLFEKKSKEEKENYKSPFSLDPNVTKHKLKLPTGVSFSEILTSQSKDPSKGGLVYAHVFPNGFIEKLRIHLKDKFDRESTLMVNSATGRSRYFDRYEREEAAGGSH
ncbi:MAG: Tfp pilus assembly protein FimT/FimU [Bacteriovoracia bacterium]